MVFIIIFIIFFFYSTCIYSTYIYSTYMRAVSRIRKIAHEKLHTGRKNDIFSVS